MRRHQHRGLFVECGAAAGRRRAVLRALHRQFPFYGLKIQATMIEADIRALLTTGRGFLDLAAELDLPFLIHSSVAPEVRPEQQSRRGVTVSVVMGAAPASRFCCRVAPIS